MVRLLDCRKQGTLEDHGSAFSQIHEDPSKADRRAMTSLRENCAYWFLRFLQITPFRGNRNAFWTSTASRGAGSCPFPQAQLEAENCAEFIGFFREFRPAVAGGNLLDVGSGYGGKTVAMARELRPAKVVGVEPFESMVSKATEYAKSVDAANCEFRLCGQLDIPAADGEFDAIFSHDVIEHVKDPRATLAEMYRVLKPGGNAYIVFTPYWGAFAHHLGYVSRAPFLHWLIGPRTLVAAVNRMLTGDYGKRFATAIQPPPQRAFNGKFDVLPTLNGISSEEFLEEARWHGFVVAHARYPTIIERYRPSSRGLIWLNRALMALHPILKEGLSFNFVCVLQKPAREQDACRSIETAHSNATIARQAIAESA